MGIIHGGKVELLIDGKVVDVGLTDFEYAVGNMVREAGSLGEDPVRLSYEGHFTVSVEDRRACRSFLDAIERQTWPHGSYWWKRLMYLRRHGTIERSRRWPVITRYLEQCAIVNCAPER